MEKFAFFSAASNWDFVIVATGVSVGKRRGLYNGAAAAMAPRRRGCLCHGAAKPGSK